MRFKVGNIPDHSNLVENGQINPIRYALCDIDYDYNLIPAMPLVACRDYFTDVIFSLRYNKATYPVYGFTFDPKDSYIFTNSTVLLIKTEYIHSLYRYLDILNNIELSNKLSPTLVYPTDKEDMFVLIADREWLQCNTHMSLYTLLIRLFTYKYNICASTFEEFTKRISNYLPTNSADSTLLKQIPISFFDLYFKNIFDIPTTAFKEFDEDESLVDDYLLSCDIDDLHNEGGFYSLYNYFCGELDVEHAKVVGDTVQLLKEKEAKKNNNK